MFTCQADGCLLCDFFVSVLCRRSDGALETTLVFTQPFSKCIRPSFMTAFHSTCNLHHSQPLAQFRVISHVFLDVRGGKLLGDKMHRGDDVEDSASMP